jgi:hypothetical protein
MLTHRQILIGTLLLIFAFGIVVGGLIGLASLYAPLPEPFTNETLLHWRNLAIPAFALALWIAGRE